MHPSTIVPGACGRVVRRGGISRSSQRAAYRAFQGRLLDVMDSSSHVSRESAGRGWNEEVRSCPREKPAIAID